ncbi:MAG: hypothetical protein KAS23_01120 [Anaerohalosphaera sp.]|nr:hypothetical protein [Anaerohalosphaera sp.]
MAVDADRISVREENTDLGLTFDVEYFSPTDQPLGSLIRVMTVTNISVNTKNSITL